MSTGALKIKTVILIVVLMMLVDFGALVTFSSTLGVQADEELRSSLVTSAHLLQNNPPERLARVLGPWRVSLLDAAGRLVQDSAIEPAQVTELDAQPELDEARRSGTGVAHRYSSVAGRPMLFVAVPLAAGTSGAAYLRLGAPTDTWLNRAWVAGLGFILLQLVVALGLAAWLWHRSKAMTDTMLSILERGASFARGENPERVYVGGPAPWPYVATSLNRIYDQIDVRMQKLRRERDELAAILNGMVEAVVVLDTQLVVKALNPTARRLFPTTRQAEGLSLIEVTRNSALDDLARELAATGADSLRGEILLSDLETTLQVQGAALRGDSGPVWGSVLVMSDITQLKRLELMRRDFVANVSHELKTPITNIKGYVETLLEGPIPAEKTQQFLSVIDRHAQRLSLIVDDLLILTRLENSPPEDGELRPVGLGDLVEGLVAQSLPRAQAKQIRLEAKVPKRGLQVTAFPLLLEQALINLVDNAIKFCPEGSRIRILVQRDGDDALIEVRDNGPGIPEREQQRVFERFYRATSGRSKEGTGLGLSIVKHIALIHRGSVVLTSPPEGETTGTSFVLRLPQDAGK